MGRKRNGAELIVIYLITLLCCFVVVCLNAVLLSEEYDHIIPVALGWVKIEFESPKPILPAMHNIDSKEKNIKEIKEPPIQVENILEDDFDYEYTYKPKKRTSYNYPYKKRRYYSPPPKEQKPPSVSDKIWNVIVVLLEWITAIVKIVFYLSTYGFFIYCIVGALIELLRWIISSF